MTTLQEDIADGEAHKSELSPGCLRFLALIGVLGGWLIGFPLQFNLIATVFGLIVFFGANKISKRGPK